LPLLTFGAIVYLLKALAYFDIEVVYFINTIACFSKVVAFLMSADDYILRRAS
jgi:hypothetical protein